MKLSEYVIVENASVLIDPLGFLKPSRALQDLLFEQFTVLTNHPSYHGMLCTASQVLEKTGLTPRDAGYARRFRRLEILWGLMNAEENDSVINVRKYKQLIGERMSARDFPPGHSIYQRLGYGTLGHYGRPSIAWGLLDLKERKLTAAGSELAVAFSRRGGQDLAALFGQWERGEEFDIQALARGAGAFHRLAEPAARERAAWRGLIAAWTARHPASAPLWKDPVPHETLEGFEASAAAYCAQYAWLSERYPSLQPQVAAIRSFERVSGAIQFVFDLRLASLAFDADAKLRQGFDGEDIAHAIVELAAPAMNVDAGRLFATLAMTRKRYADVQEAIASHHCAHQRSKGVSPYFEGNDLLVRDKVSPKEVGGVLEDLAACAGVEQKLDRLQYRSRRDWHFRRCSTYHGWAEGQRA